MTRQTPGTIRLARHRRGSVAIMVALLALPLIGIIGLAIDFALYSQTYSALTAAARAATLNAVKVAAAGAAAGNATYIQDGQNAGMKWFIAQSGTTSLIVSNSSGSVTVTPGTTITASLNWTARVPSTFGAIFGVKTYNMTITAQAQQTLAPYVEVIMLLDNSASMGIGAGAADIATLMKNSPCDPSNEITSTTGAAANYNNIVNIPYANYECTYTQTYDGQNSPWNAPACPFTPGNSTYTYQSSSLTYVSPNNVSSTNKKYNGSNFTCPGKVNGYTAYPGPPCAFACHSDGTKAAGLGNDLWAMARKSGVTLRSDLLKNATQQVISTMQTRDPAGTALSLGVYTFDTGLTQIYPSSGEAGSNWSAASTAVGFPPATGHLDETGIQPSVATITTATIHVNGNTDFANAMTTLASGLTAAGSGATAAAPRKALFLITDGIYDLPSGDRGAMPSSYCQQFQNMGYEVFVLYTMYYPVMNQTYLNDFMPIVEGTDSNSVTYNLQNCSSSTGAADLGTYYIQATNQTAITNALQGFLASALASPARYTQ